MTERTHDSDDRGDDSDASGAPTRAGALESIDTGPIDVDREAAPTPGRRGFGKLLLAGAAGAAGVAGLGGTASAEAEWREAYFEFAADAFEVIREELARPEVVERMLAVEAEATELFDVLGERVDLEQTTVGSATVEIRPCGGPPLPDPWGDELEDLLDDLGIPSRCPMWPCPDPHPRFVLVPAVSAHLRGPEGAVVVEVDPRGESAGVFVEVPDLECERAPDACDPVFDYRRFTPEGWERLGEGGVDLGGDPIPFPA